MYAAPGRLRELGQQCGLASARSLRTASDPMYVCARKGCDGNVSRHVKVISTHTYIHTLHTMKYYLVISLHTPMRLSACSKNISFKDITYEECMYVCIFI